MSVFWRSLTRTLFAAVLAVVLAGALLGACAADPADAPPVGGPPPPLPRGTAVLTDSNGESRTVLVEIASTPQERALGLMGRAALPADSGMAFLFDEPSGGGFWMKDTLIPLEIAFWNADGTIVDIQQMVPCDSDPCERYPAAAPFVGALEVNPGTFEAANIEVGDTIEVVPGEEAVLGG